MRALAPAVVAVALAAGPASAAEDVFPRWSPDGTRIAFIRFDAGRADGLYVVGRTGGGLRRLSTIPGSYAWAPRGDLIAQGTFAGMQLLRPDGSVAALLDTGSAANVAWSPDGRTLAFRGGLNLPPRFEVWAIEVEGTGLRRLAAGMSSSDHPDAGRLAWSPDSNRVAFAAAGEIGVVTRDGRDERRFAIPLQSTSDLVEAPVWSPDGRRIAVPGAAVIDMDAGAVAASLFGLREVAWSPSGARLAAVRNGPRFPFPGSDTSDLSLTEPDGRRGRLIARTTWIHRLDPRWSPDGRHVAFVGESVCRGTGIYTAAVAGDRVRRVTNRCTIEGTVGSDRIRGTDLADVVLARGADDHVWSRGGSDVVYAGAGNDLLDGRGERDDRDVDRLVAGPGDDVLVTVDGAVDVVHCGPGDDRVRADVGDLVGAGCEDIVRDDSERGGAQANAVLAARYVSAALARNRTTIASPWPSPPHTCCSTRPSRTSFAPSFATSSVSGTSTPAAAG